MLKYGFPFHSTKGGKIVGLGFGKDILVYRLNLTNISKQLLKEGNLER
jgi:hypothetical protein